MGLAFGNSFHWIWAKDCYSRLMMMLTEEDYDEQVLLCPPNSHFSHPHQLPYKLDFPGKITSQKAVWLWIFPENLVCYQLCLMIMARAVKANALLLRQMKRLKRQFNNLSAELRANEETLQKEDVETEAWPYNSSTWVPHPRTGIYFPQGHEWVMKDVPENAASFSRVCWFRDSDGVDDPNPDQNPSSGPRFAAAFGTRE